MMRYMKPIVWLLYEFNIKIIRGCVQLSSSSKYEFTTLEYKTNANCCNKSRHKSSVGDCNGPNKLSRLTILFLDPLFTTSYESCNMFLKLISPRIAAVFEHQTSENH